MNQKDLNSKIYNFTILHNFYSSDQPSGENDAVLQERTLLGESKHNVKILATYTDDLYKMNILAKVYIFLKCVVFGFPHISRDIRAAIDQADVVHIHNTFPFYGYRLIRILRRQNIRIIMTIHSARLSCLRASHSYKGSPCFKCSASGSYAYGVVRKCYRERILYSYFYARYMSKLKRDFIKVDQFIVLNAWTTLTLKSLGVDPTKVTILRNSIEGPETFVASKQKSLFFAGRLTNEKGIDLLLDAWMESHLKLNGWTLRIAGAGPLEEKIKSLASEHSSVEFFGYLTESEINHQLNSSSYVCVPSISFEGFPNMIAKAASHGRPVLTSNFGPLSELSSYNWIKCIEADKASWVKALNWVDNNQPTFELQNEARLWWEENSSPSAVISKMLGVMKFD